VFCYSGYLHLLGHILSHQERPSFVSAEILFRQQQANVFPVYSYICLWNVFDTHHRSSSLAKVAEQQHFLGIGTIILRSVLYSPAILKPMDPEIKCEKHKVAVAAPTA
jgi:hypothetical protein